MSDQDPTAKLLQNNLPQRIAAGIVLIAYALMLVVWFGPFQQMTPRVYTHFPEGSCDGASTCTNAEGGFGALQSNGHSFNIWWFNALALNFFALVGAALVGGIDRLANSVAIVLSVLIAMVNIGLLFYLFVAWVPYVNKPHASSRENPFNDPRACCTPEFYQDPQNRCPNGQPNYPAGSEETCVAPLTTLTLNQLTIRGDMIYLTVALFLWIVGCAILAVAAFFSIQDPTQLFGVLSQFVGATMDILLGPSPSQKENKYDLTNDEKINKNKKMQYVSESEDESYYSSDYYDKKEQ